MWTHEAATHRNRSRGLAGGRRPRRRGPEHRVRAHGILIIDGAAYQDPRGCLPLGDFVQPVVTNYTDSVVQVRAGTSCAGPVEKFVVPGETYAALGGRSVLVP